MANQTHALYRFYDASDHLLYIGITMDPGARWKTHSKDKPWWLDVARVTVEHHLSRRAVLDAERAAITAEKPRHNIVHNRGGSAAIHAAPQLDRLMPIQVGDWVALGLKDGRCPVGGVAAVDDVWISVRLKEFLMGSLTNRVIAVRWDEVARVEMAYPEDSTEEHGERRIDDEHLGPFQTAWHRVHFGKGGQDPVDQARIDEDRESQEKRAKWEREAEHRRQERLQAKQGLTPPSWAREKDHQGGDA